MKIKTEIIGDYNGVKYFSYLNSHKNKTKDWKAIRWVHKDQDQWAGSECNAALELERDGWPVCLFPVIDLLSHNKFGDLIQHTHILLPFWK